MSYENDKKEIISFIEAAYESNNSENGNEWKRAFERFICKIDEEYLTDRSEFLKKEILSDRKLEKAFKKLAIRCTGERQKCDDCIVKKFCNTFISYKRELARNNPLKIVDLFCGAGGLSLGFTQEGFVSVLANDIEACCIDTYAHNHPETRRDHIILGDIREVISNIGNLLENEEIDLVIGGPPCQGFSMANRQRLIDDLRNKLYKEFLKVVEIVNPKFFLMENVKGMLGVADQVKEDFEALGYTVSFCVLNAKNFGVPQNRERLIYIGNRINVDNDKIFEDIEREGEKIPNMVLKDALFGLRPLEASRERNATEKGTVCSGFKIEKNAIRELNDYLHLINKGKVEDVICNHKARYNNERDIEIYKRLNQGDRSDDPKIADIMPYSRRNNIFKDKYFKLENDKVCKTITAHMKYDCNMYIHPTQGRGLTPREAARIQSYPDSYFFRGAYTKTYMQIGNSVPPLLGRGIAKVIKKYLEGGKSK